MPRPKLEACRVTGLVAHDPMPRPQGGYTPMHLAAYQGYVQIVDMLIEKGASVNRQDSDGDGYAPLHLAAQEGKIDVSRALLQRGAEPNVQNDVSSVTLCAWPHRGGDRFYPCMSAVPCPTCQPQPPPFSLTSAPDNVRVQMGDTALHLALRNSHYALARVLLAGGADVTIEDDEGQIPLDECKDDAVRRELQEAAAEVRVGCRCGSRQCGGHVVRRADVTRPRYSADPRQRAQRSGRRASEPRLGRPMVASCCARSR